MLAGHALTPGFSSGKTINYLRGAAPLALATKSDRCQGQWKWNTAESMSAMMLVGFWSQDLLILVSQDACFFQNIPKQDGEKSPLWGVFVCSLLSSPEEDEWHLEATGQRRKRVRAQRPSVAM